MAAKDKNAAVGRSLTGLRGNGSKMATLSMNRGSPLNRGSPNGLQGRERLKIPGGVDLSELRSIMSGGA
jgi:hypothetical protein